LTKALGIALEEVDGDFCDATMNALEAEEVSTLKQLAERSQRALAWVELERDNLRVECGRLREEVEARVRHEGMDAHAELKKARADMAQATRITDIGKDEKEIANRTRESEYRARICVELERDVLGQQVLDLREELEGLKKSTAELNQEALR
jgi:N-methylhydantoinase A/oxoprolinase/acetone carboxylase beta subunit